jgi:hypothetical protein
MNDNSPDHGHIHVTAKALGGARIYQVAQGEQKIHNHYHVSVSAPPDLAALRTWIDSVIAAYGKATHDRGFLREARALKHSLDDSSTRSRSADTIRRLAAAGLTQYVRQAAAPVPDSSPEQVMLDIAVFALWPIVIAPKLPAHWPEHLAEMTSPRIAALVAQARSAGRQATVEKFLRLVADKPSANWILNLLEDLSDPRRGGASLTAIAVAAGLPRPPSDRNARATMAWIVAAAAGGAAGSIAAAEARVIIDDMWAWATGSQANTTGTEDPASSLTHGNGSHRGSNRPGGVIDDILDHLFHH